MYAKKKKKTKLVIIILSVIVASFFIFLKLDSNNLSRIREETLKRLVNPSSYESNSVQQAGSPEQCR
jgi:uncharacterized protein YpmB